MGIGRFFRDVFCAPYSIPIGIINSNLTTLGMCSESKTLSLEIDEEVNQGGITSETLSHEDEDIISSSEMIILNQAIQDILIKTHNISTIRVDGSITANIYSFTIDDNGEMTMVLSSEEDPNHDYTSYIYDYKTERMGDDGNIYYVYEFGCPPSIDQVQTISTVQISEINQNIFEEIYLSLIHI